MKGRVPLTAQIAAGLLLGVAAGLLVGKPMAALGDVGKLVIQAIKVAAGPLLMLAIINAVLQARVTAKSGLRMVVLSGINACIALAFGLILSNLLEPGKHLAGSFTPSNLPAAVPAAAQKVSVMGFFAGIIPTSLVSPFADNAVMPLAIMALVFALALRKLKDKGEPTRDLERAFELLQQATETILGWIILAAPLAVFAVVAKAVGENGLAPLRGLAAYVGVGLLGLALHPLITYGLWLKLYARMDLRKFWEAAKEPMVYSIGANSSLATLPLTLKGLDQLGVSQGSAALGACVGTNLNNDGIILYEAMAVLFVAQAHGIVLSLPEQMAAAAACLIAAMGIAGVPEAGFISLALVLATVGLPMEILPLLLTVDWILARARSVVNVLSDMLISILLDRWNGVRFQS